MAEETATRARLYLGVDGQSLHVNLHTDACYDAYRCSDDGLNVA